MNDWASSYLKSVDDDVLMFAVRSKLLEQPFPDTTNDFYRSFVWEQRAFLSQLLSWKCSAIQVPPRG